MLRNINNLYCYGVKVCQELFVKSNSVEKNLGVTITELKVLRQENMIFKLSQGNSIFISGPTELIR